MLIHNAEREREGEGERERKRSGIIITSSSLLLFILTFIVLFKGTFRQHLHSCEKLPHLFH